MQQQADPRAADGASSATAPRGVRLSVLQDLVRGCKPKATVQDIVDAVVVPATRNPTTNTVDKAYIDTLPKDKVGPATVFVSYKRSFQFGEQLLSILESFARREATPHYFWLDLMALPQRKGVTNTPDELKKTFATSIDRIARCLVVLAPLRQPENFESCWCLYEMYHMMYGGGARGAAAPAPTPDITILLPDSDIEEVLEKLVGDSAEVFQLFDELVVDVQQSKTREPADKTAILKLIAEVPADVNFHLVPSRAADKTAGEATFEAKLRLFLRSALRRSIATLADGLSRTEHLKPLEQIKRLLQSARVHYDLGAYTAALDRCESALLALPAAHSTVAATLAFEAQLLLADSKLMLCEPQSLEAKDALDVYKTLLAELSLDRILPRLEVLRRQMAYAALRMGSLKDSHKRDKVDEIATNIVGLAAKDKRAVALRAMLEAFTTQTRVRCHRTAGLDEVREAVQLMAEASRKALIPLKTQTLKLPGGQAEWEKYDPPVFEAYKWAEFADLYLAKLGRDSRGLHRGYTNLKGLLEQQARVLGTEHAAYGESLVLLGRAEQYCSEHEGKPSPAAFLCFQQAAHTVKSALGSNHFRTSVVQCECGLYLKDCGRLKEAEAWLEEGTSFFKRAGTALKTVKAGIARQERGERSPLNFTPHQLDGLERRALQKLAMEHGIKGNESSEKMRRELRLVYDKKSAPPAPLQFGDQ